jgi:hypothetical protein
VKSLSVWLGDDEVEVLVGPSLGSDQCVNAPITVNPHREPSGLDARENRGGIARPHGRSLSRAHHRIEPLTARQLLSPTWTAVVVDASWKCRLAARTPGVPESPRPEAGHARRPAGGWGRIRSGWQVEPCRAKRDPA